MCRHLRLISREMTILASSTPWMFLRFNLPYTFRGRPSGFSCFWGNTFGFKPLSQSKKVEEGTYVILIMGVEQSLQSEVRKSRLTKDEEEDKS